MRKDLQRQPPPVYVPAQPLHQSPLPESRILTPPVWSIPHTPALPPRFQLPPACLPHLHAKSRRSSQNALPRRIPFCLRHSLHLVKPRNRIPNVRRIFQRLLPLRRKGKLPTLHFVALFCIQLAHRCFLLPPPSAIPAPRAVQYGTPPAPHPQQPSLSPTARHPHAHGCYP